RHHNRTRYRLAVRLRTALPARSSRLPSRVHALSSAADARCPSSARASREFCGLLASYWAVKLTTKTKKDTENFALFFRSAGHLRSGERCLLARRARQLAEHKFPRWQASLQCSGSARVSRVGDDVSSSRTFARKDCFGETPKVRAGLAFARETLALPRNRSELSMRSGVFSRLRCVLLLMMRFLWIAVLLISVGCHPAQTQVADFPAQRERMVKEQIVMRGVVEERVLAAMRKVPREEFVPAEFRAESYTDRPLPI